LYSGEEFMTAEDEIMYAEVHNPMELYCYGRESLLRNAYGPKMRRHVPQMKKKTAN
jgi:hypothetical protein